jgi:hypothetical protein
MGRSLMLRVGPIQNSTLAMGQALRSWDAAM